MPVDPQIQGLLDKGTGVPATHTLPIDVARAQYEVRIALLARPADIAGVREHTIDGPGGPLRIRIYTPHGTGPFPLLVFFHGMTIMTNDKMMAQIVALSGGYTRADACKRLSANHGMIASFSRALAEDLKHSMSDAVFEATLAKSIEEIYRASTVKV